MTDAPPIFTDSVRERVRARLGGGDLGGGLVEVFAQLADVAVDRLNQVPDKNFLAFLDMVGTRLAPPQPSRVPLTFTLAPGAATEVLVPAGTQVAAEPEAGDPGPVTFETERDLVATPAQLVAAFVREPGRDRYRDVTAAALGQAAPFEAFVGTEPIAHRFFVASAAFALPAPNTVILELGRPAPWLHALRWTRWDGERWADVDDVLVDAPAGTVEFFHLPAVALLALGADPQPRPWLRATLATSIPAVAGSPPDRVMRTDTTIESVQHGGPPVHVAPIDWSRPFPPFAQMQSGAALAVRCDEAFSKPGAQVTVSFTIEGAEPGPTRDLTVDWKYSRGTRAPWGLLGQSSSSGADDFDDGTHALLTAGDVTFEAPDDWRPTLFYGQTGWWLRAVIVEATYAAPALPSVTALRVGYDWALPELSLPSVSAGVEVAGLRPHLAYTNVTPVDLNKPLLPFGDAPRPNDAFYLASEAFSAPARRAVLTVTLTSPDPGDTAALPPPAGVEGNLRLAWEHWDESAREWLTIGESGRGAHPVQPDGFVDGTRGLREHAGPSADIELPLPPSAGAVEVNGETRAWLRVRIVSGAYGRDATYKQVDDDDATKGYYVVPANHAPPSIESIRIAYDYDLPATPAEALQTENDFELSDRTGEAGTFRPFAPPRDARSTLYLGMDRTFSDQQIQFYIGVLAPRSAGDEIDTAPVVAWEYWDRLEAHWARLEPVDETEAFTGRGLVGFIGPAALGFSRQFGLPFDATWLRARWERGEYASPPRIARVAANTMWATNATTTRLEDLGASPGAPDLVRRLSRAPVLAGERLEVREAEPPADLGEDAVTIVRDAAGRPEQVWVRWSAVEDFYDSEPRSRHYMVDRSTGDVRFGDGRRGLIPPGPLRASYRSGGGALGNRAVGRITQLKSAVPYVVGVTNLEVAAGGVAAGTLEDARRYGPRRLRHRDRAVTLADYEDLAAEASPEVARSKALPVRTAAEAGQVRVVVVPASADPQPAPSLELLARVRAQLRARMSGAVALWVGGPGWIRVDVTAEVAPRSIDRAAAVESAVLARLVDYLHPLRGGAGASGWEFGRGPHESELVAVLERVAGVDHVRSLDLVEHPVTGDPPTADAVLVWSGEHRITMVAPDPGGGS